MKEINNIPNNWELKSIKEAFEIVKEKGRENSVPYLEIGDIDINSKTYILKSKPAVKGCKISKKGDLLISRVRPTRGAIVQIKEETIPVSSAFTILRNQKLLFDSFAFYFFAWNNEFHNYLGNNCSGSLYPTVSESILTDYKILIPPYKEQKLIVSKIEELFSELESGKQQLLTAQQQLKVYRQSLLKWAFESNDYPIFNMVDLNIKIQIGPFGTQLHKDDYIENGIPLINPMHIQNGKIVPNYSYSIRNEKMQSLPNYILKEGDVIMGRRGEMGRCGLVSKTEDGWFCGTGSLYFRPNPTKLNSRFLYYYLSSQPIKKYLELNAGGTTMANLNLKIVKEIPIKLPEIKEQEQIVNEIESKLTVCDKIEETIRQSLLQAETLKQSILKKAFEGKLVTTEKMTVVNELQ